MTESFLCRLPAGGDLLESITQAFRDRGIRKAAFNVIGLTTHAVVAYYDPQIKEYKTRILDAPHEIVSCMGNVSEKDGDVFVHAHLVLAAEDYTCVGGHLMPGTIIFAAELHGIPVAGPVPVRNFDDFTGLFLWPEP